jgi:hypothetical protein
LGALLAAPVIASVREIIRYLYMKILGEEPFPPGQELPVEKEPFWRKYTQILLVRFQRKPAPPPPVPAETQTPPPPLEAVASVEENKPK